MGDRRAEHANAAFFSSNDGFLKVSGLGRAHEEQVLYPNRMIDASYRAHSFKFHNRANQLSVILSNRARF